MDTTSTPMPEEVNPESVSGTPVESTEETAPEVTEETA